MIDVQDRNYLDGQFKDLRKNTDEHISGLHTRINDLQKETFSKISKDRIKVAVVESQLGNHINKGTKCQKAEGCVGNHYTNYHKGSILRILGAIIVGSTALLVIAKAIEVAIKYGGQ